MTKLWGCVLGFACLVGMAAATAQSPGALLTGTWIGGLESDGQFEFYAATVEDVGRAAGTATVPMRGLSDRCAPFHLKATGYALWVPHRSLCLALLVAMSSQATSKPREAEAAVDFACVGFQRSNPTN
jgi:hypothetical protein